MSDTTQAPEDVVGSEVEPTVEGEEDAPVTFRDLDVSVEGFDAAVVFEQLVAMDPTEMNRAWRLLRPEQVEAIKLHAETLAPPPVVDEEVTPGGAAPEIEPEEPSSVAAASPAPFAVDEFVPVPATDPKYRAIVDRAKAIAKSAVKTLDGEAREQVAALIAQAEQYPTERAEYGDAMQRAEHVAQRSKDEAFARVPFGRVVRSRQFVDPTGTVRQHDTDSNGRTREVSVVVDDSVDREQGDGFGDRITPTDVADWPMDKMLRFRAQHPDAWEQLKAGGNIAFEPSLPAGPPEPKSRRPIWLGAR